MPLMPMSSSRNRRRGRLPSIGLSKMTKQTMSMNRVWMDKTTNCTMRWVMRSSGKVMPAHNKSLSVYWNLCKTCVSQMFCTSPTAGCCIVNTQLFYYTLIQWVRNHIFLCQHHDKLLVRHRLYTSLSFSGDCQLLCSRKLNYIFIFKTNFCTI